MAHSIMRLHVLLLLSVAAKYALCTWLVVSHVTRCQLDNMFQPALYRVATGGIQLGQTPRHAHSAVLWPLV